MIGTAYGVANEAARETKVEAIDPLRSLLHALNQPLTALQCMLELSTSTSRGVGQYVGTIHEALDLTSRMRLLVEALQEVANIRQPGSIQRNTTFSIGVLLRDMLAELLPVAESRHIRLQVLGETDRLISADHDLLSTALFRLLESALNLSCKGGDLKILGLPEDSTICLILSWRSTAPHQHARITRQQLGLVVAQCALERAGANCHEEQQGQSCTYKMRLPLASPASGEISEVQK